MTRIVRDPKAIKTVANAMTEAELQRAVTEMCDWLGLLHWHDNDSTRNAAGFPDLVIVGKRVLHRELKAMKGRVRVDQQRWITRINAAEGGDAAVWRPIDLLDGTVAATLKGIKP